MENSELGCPGSLQQNREKGVGSLPHALFAERGYAGMKIPMTAGILAGGKSTRMGRDKALLPYRRQTFLEHLAGELKDFDELLVSVEGNLISGIPDNYITVQDELEGFGPVEGIYQLLRRASHPYVLVVATDMQRLTAAFLRDLTAALRPEDRCLVPHSGALLEPLCSVYHKEALPILAHMRAAGIHRPRFLFERMPTHYVSLEALGYDMHIVENINTQEDYHALLYGESMSDS